MPSLILSLVVWTSVLGCFLLRKNLTTGRIREALLFLLDCFGMTVVFFAANLASGMIAILVLRSFTPIFVSLYMLGDPALLVLSFFQGLLFQFWRTQSASSRTRITAETRRSREEM